MNQRNALRADMDISWDFKIQLVQDNVNLDSGVQKNPLSLHSVSVKKDVPVEMAQIQIAKTLVQLGTSVNGIQVQKIQVHPMSLFYVCLGSIVQKDRHHQISVLEEDMEVSMAYKNSGVMEFVLLDFFAHQVQQHLHRINVVLGNTAQQAVLHPQIAQGVGMEI